VVRGLLVEINQRDRRMAFRMWSAIMVMVAEADTWRAVAGRNEDEARVLLDRGQVQDAAALLGRAEAYNLAAANVDDALRALKPRDTDLACGGPPTRWGWAVRRLLRRITR
jgi:hypothetical protein